MPQHLTWSRSIQLSSPLTELLSCFQILRATKFQAVISDQESSTRICYVTPSYHVFHTWLRIQDTPESPKLPYPKPSHANQPPATCCNCCIWRCCSSALPQSHWASVHFWSPLWTLWFLFVLTEFCQTSAVHNLQYLVQFKVSLNPWNPQKIAGLEVLEMIPRFRCYTWRPSKWRGSTPTWKFCSNLPFVFISRTSCGVSNSFSPFFAEALQTKSHREPPVGRHDVTKDIGPKRSKRARCAC